MAVFQLFINCFHCVRDASVQVPFLDPCQIAPYRRLAEKLVLSDRDLHLTLLFLEILFVLQVCDANVLHLSPSFTPLYHGCEGFCRSDIRGYYVPKSPTLRCLAIEEGVSTIYAQRALAKLPAGFTTSRCELHKGVPSFVVAVPLRGSTFAWIFYLISRPGTEPFRWPAWPADSR